MYHDGGSPAIRVNQKVNGWDWVPIGTYSLTPGAGAKVRLDNAQAGTVCADAIAFGRDRNDRRVVADAVKFVPNTAEAVLAVHADHLGTPQKMTDGAGAVVWDAAYRPFGEAAAISGAANNNQRFPGQYFDAETGLHQNWMRDYDPSTGRYVQSDPIGLRGGVNKYLYGLANPARMIDPKGLLSSWEAVKHYFFGEDDQHGNRKPLDASFSEVDIGLQPRDFIGFRLILATTYRQVRRRPVDVREARTVAMPLWAGHITFRLKGTLISTYCSWDFNGYVAAFDDEFDFNEMPWGVRNTFAELITRMVGYIPGGKAFDIKIHGRRNAQDRDKWR